MAYRAGRQVTKIAFVSVVVGAQAAGLALAAGPLAAESGWWLAGALLLYGAACVVGMGVYARCYVRAIDVALDPDGAPVATIRTLWPGPPLRLREADLLGHQHHDGQMVGRGIWVDAPWTTVRVRGRRLPLIVDAQGVWSAAGRGDLLRRLGQP